MARYDGRNYSVAQVRLAAQALAEQAGLAVVREAAERELVRRGLPPSPRPSETPPSVTEIRETARAASRRYGQTVHMRGVHNGRIVPACGEGQGTITKDWSKTSCRKCLGLRPR